MKFDTKIQIFAIVIIYTLIILIQFNQTDCNQCIVEFKNTKVSGAMIELPPITKGVTELYTELNKGRCPVVWNKNQGYIYD